MPILWVLWAVFVDFELTAIPLFVCPCFVTFDTEFYDQPSTDFAFITLPSLPKTTVESCDQATNVQCCGDADSDGNRDRLW